MTFLILGILNIALFVGGVFVFVSSAWQDTNLGRHKRVLIGAGMWVTAILIGVACAAYKGML